MKESFEYYEEDTGFWIFIPGDDFREYWDNLVKESEQFVED